ncbi:MAG TPA: hypothetical protein EYQ24_09145 [Bacteroidetes bacterium]|nr:hypothetical protein [Bacteroidota bacterium]HIL58880.1 hypothetical protein [Rhodothermales bacterium]
MYRLLALALLLSACALTDPSDEWANVREDSAEGVLVNQTSEAIYALGVDAETATRIDIAPEFTLADDDRDGVVAPGEAGALDVEAYDRGDGVVVFVYRVEADRAAFARSIAIDGEAFVSADGVVTVRQL